MYLSLRFAEKRWIVMSLRLVWSNSLSGKQFSATLSAVRAFGTVCRDIRTASGLSQKEVAEAGGLEQSRVSEIERGRYLPGLDLAVRMAKGLGVTLTEIVSQWEGTSADALPAAGRQRARRRIPAPAMDVAQEDLFRRVRGLWELLSPDRREVYWKHGKALVTEQWKEESLGDYPRPAESSSKVRPRASRRDQR
jgi:transcriptional regulator with XRE-family HTH domain